MGVGCCPRPGTDFGGDSVKKKRSLLAGEWQFTIRRPLGPRAQNVSVRVQSVGCKDLPFAKALARLVAIWLGAR